MKHDDLFQQRAIGDLLPEAQHGSHGESGEHGGAGVPDQRVLRPHGPGIPNQLLLFVSGGPDGAVPLLPVPAPAVVQEDCGSYRGLLMTLKLGGMLQLASS